LIEAIVALEHVVVVRLLREPGRIDWLVFIFDGQGNRFRV
jgi:hypothetical protein